jgi:hypothetical protein
MGAVLTQIVVQVAGALLVALISTIARRVWGTA